MNINKRAQFDKQKTFATTQQRQALMELDLNKCLEPTLEVCLHLKIHIVFD